MLKTEWKRTKQSVEPTKCQMWNVQKHNKMKRTATKWNEIVHIEYRWICFVGLYGMRQPNHENEVMWKKREKMCNVPMNGWCWCVPVPVCAYREEQPWKCVIKRWHERKGTIGWCNLLIRKYANFMTFKHEKKYAWIRRVKCMQQQIRYTHACMYAYISAIIMSNA